MMLVKVSIAGIMFWFGIVLGHGFARAQAARDRGANSSPQDAG